MAQVLPCVFNNEVYGVLLANYEMLHKNEPEHNRNLQNHVCPVKTQISLTNVTVYLIRVLAGRSICTAFKDPKCLLAYSKDWYDYVHTQPDLSLHSVHMSFCRFCCVPPQILYSFLSTFWKFHGVQTVQKCQILSEFFSLKVVTKFFGGIF